MRILSTQLSLNNKSFELYISGCKPPHCEGCFNPETWDFDQGDFITNDLLDKIRYKISDFNELIDNIYILGGEPLHQELDQLLDLINFLKEFDKPIWLFTRFEYEDVPNKIKEVCDYIKCGKYDINQKADEKFIQHGVILGSYNQKIYMKG